MEKKCFVICDSEREYAFRLSSLLSKKIDYQIHVCSSFKEVQRIADEKKIGILLVEEGIFENQSDAVAEVVILLSERNREGENKVCKYQSFDEILSDILNICMEEQQQGVLKRQICKSCSLIGVYSPISRVGKTTFAIALGKEAAKREPVLYLNLETYSGWEEWSGKSEPYTLADLLYYAKQEKGNLETRIGAMTGYLDELAYIAPMEMSEDLKAVTVNEWMNLLETLRNRKIYKKIIFDFGECVQGLWDMLSMCNEIYMPVREGRISKGKVFQFEKNLRLLGREELLEKIVRIQLGKDISKDVKRILKRKEWRDDRSGTTP